MSSHPVPLGSDESAEDYESSLKPSQYTCMLLDQAIKYFSSAGCKRVLDMGVGSGVMLAAAAQQGVADLWGIDVNPNALKAAASLLKRAAPDSHPRLLLGDLWTPLPDGLRFSLVVANLPHFPGAYHDQNRPLGWDGGEGRQTINKLITGLEGRLEEEGLALITHHDLIGFEESRALIEHCGLRCETLLQWSVFEPPERMHSVAKSTLDSAHAQIRRYGGYAFMNARILKIFR